jgi:hypothetical protein
MMLIFLCTYWPLKIFYDEVYIVIFFPILLEFLISYCGIFAFFIFWLQFLSQKHGLQIFSLSLWFIDLILLILFLGKHFQYWQLNTVCGTLLQMVTIMHNKLWLTPLEWSNTCHVWHMQWHYECIECVYFYAQNSFPFFNKYFKPF